MPRCSIVPSKRRHASKMVLCPLMNKAIEGPIVTLFQGGRAMSIEEKCSCSAGTSFTDKRNAPHAQRVTVPVCKAVRIRALLDGGLPLSTGLLLVRDGGFPGR